MVEQNGVYKKQEIWVLDTIGTNLLDVLGLDFIDNKRTVSNDIVEIYNAITENYKQMVVMYDEDRTKDKTAWASKGVKYSFDGNI